MEGFLVKSGIARFQRRWFSLSSAELSYYLDFDTDKDEPVNNRGVFIVKSATVEKVVVESRQFCINLKLSDGKVICLDAEKADNQETWVKALEAAAKLHLDEAEEARLLSDACLKLGFDARDLMTISLKELSRSYKKASLKCHPDKGGDVNTFNELYNAFNLLDSKRRFDQELKTTRRVEYEALIEKGGTGVGLGVKVYDDKIRKQILIRTVETNIILRGVSEESEGYIKSGDVLVGIGNDDINGWPLSRVKARLNNFRVPVGSSIRMTLERRVPLDIFEDEDKANKEATNDNDDDKKKQEEEVVNQIPIPTDLSTLPNPHDLEDNAEHAEQANDNNDQPEEEEPEEFVIPNNSHHQAAGVVPPPLAVVATQAKPTASAPPSSSSDIEKDALIASLRQQVQTLQSPSKPSAINNNQETDTVTSILDWASTGYSLLVESKDFADQAKHATEKYVHVEAELEVVSSKRKALEDANRELAELVAVKEVVVSGLEKEVKVTREIVQQRDLLKVENQRLIDQLKDVINQRDSCQDEVSEAQRLLAAAREENEEIKKILVERHGGSLAMVSMVSVQQPESLTSNAVKKASMNAATMDDLWQEIYTLRSSLRQEKKASNLILK